MPPPPLHFPPYPLRQGKIKTLHHTTYLSKPTQKIPSHSIYPKHEIQYMLINSQNKVSCSVHSEYVKQDINNSTAESVELSHQTLAAQSESHSQTVRQPAQCFIVLSPVHTHEAAESFPYTSLTHHGRQTRYVVTNNINNNVSVENSAIRYVKILS